MTFFKETDYHGSRTYDVEPQVPVNHFGLRLSLTFAWARLQIDKFFRWVAPPVRTSSLMDGGEKHFTMLGSRQRAVTARRRIMELFPVSDAADRSRSK